MIGNKWLIWSRRQLSIKAHTSWQSERAKKALSTLSEHFNDAEYIIYAN